VRVIAPTLATGLLIAALPVPSIAATYDLWAGAGQNDTSKGVDVGYVEVWNDANNLYVKYVVDVPGWRLAETHLYVGSEQPVAKKKGSGPLPPGQFPYDQDDPESDKTNWPTENLYTIPLYWQFGTTIYVAAHAIVEQFEVIPGGFVQTEITTQTLWAGQYINAGSVTVYREGDDLIVTVNTTGDWLMTSAKLAIGTCDENGNPVWPAEILNAQGHPVPGQFPYKSPDLSPGTNTYTFPPISISANGWDAGDSICFLVHADLIRVDPQTGEIVQTETGWAGDEEFPGVPEWVYYFCITLPEAEEQEDQEVVVSTETAWAGVGIPRSPTNDPWGWYFEYTVVEP